MLDTHVRIYSSRGFPVPFTRSVNRAVYVPVKFVLNIFFIYSFIYFLVLLIYCDGWFPILIALYICKWTKVSLKHDPWTKSWIRDDSRLILFCMPVSNFVNVIVNERLFCSSVVSFWTNETFGCCFVASMILKTGNVTLNLNFYGFTRTPSERSSINCLFCVNAKAFWLYFVTR